MKKLILSCATLALMHASYGQAVITDADMPVVGDTLRSSDVFPVSASINLGNTGANIAWDFSTLIPVSQSVDKYRLAIDVNPDYDTIDADAYGYEVADTFDTGNPQLSVTEVYNFFSKKTNPSRYVVVGYAAKVLGLATPANYSDEDEWYIFPLNYGNADTSTYKLNASVANLGNLIVTGTRRTYVDGWGTIKTPHFTTAVNCLRIRTEIDEIDTVSSPLLPSDMVIPRKTVEYRWLTPGEHYPALWVTEEIDDVSGDAEISSIRFRDNYRSFGGTGIAEAKPSIQLLTAYPIPAKEDVVTINIPKSWKNPIITIFSKEGKLVSRVTNTTTINTAGWAAGEYFARVISGSNTGYVRLSK